MLKSDHATPLLRIHLWLPVAPGVKARLPSTVFKTLCDLTSPCMPPPSPPPRRLLTTHFQDLACAPFCPKAAPFSFT